MLIERIVFRFLCGMGDRKILKKMRLPDDIERRTNMSYGKYGIWNLLDVFYPKGTGKPLPAIIYIHGGGYVYGTKEIYQYYCMDLARRGFTVVSFNYRLAPEIKFPSPVMETNQVMEWACANASEYFIDLNNIFINGDSAGAQLACQYCAIAANPEYAALFGVTVPSFRLKAVALNCGIYEINGAMPGLLLDYFGKDPLEHGDKINTLKYIDERYPPAFIMSSANDFLLPHARPMHEYLQKKGVESVFKVYGAKKQKEIAHVFHLNILSDTARECNDDECDFFKKHIG